MKQKWVTLLLALCCAFGLSALTACVYDETYFSYTNPNSGEESSSSLESGGDSSSSGSSGENSGDNSSSGSSGENSGDNSSSESSGENSGSTEKPHTHNFNIPKKDENYHWMECGCGEQTATSAHNYNIDDFNVKCHWKECSCGARIDEVVHTYEAGECVCGAKERKATEGLTYTPSEDNTYYILSGLGNVTDTDIVIPATYNNLPVKEIGARVFYECMELTSVTIPESISYIGSEAFVCPLSSVYIDDLAAWCAIDFADIYSNPLISFYAKYEIEYGGILENMDSFLESISLYVEGHLATKLEIPEGVTSINDYAFCFGWGIDEITIPDSVTTIGSGAFFNCIGLTNVTIPDSVTTIGGGAFVGCSSLTDVTIPDSVTTIGDGAFGSCSSLTSVTIGSNVTTIGVNAFGACSSLTNVTIGSNVTTIGDGAFSGCDSLTSITIPDSVTTIGEAVFSHCLGLTSITVDERNTTYQSIGGNLYTKDGRKLIQYAIGKTATEFTLPDSVTTIAAEAFSNCSNLTNVTIGSSVTTIGANAFSGCSGLTNVIIPDSVTAIGRFAFSRCSNLTNLTIGSGVTTIEYGTFEGCSSLTDLTIGSGVTIIGDVAFTDCSNLSNVTLPDIKRKGFHSLRHTFATRALECGMDVKTLSEILGHKNPTVTLNRYVHSMFEHKKDMMNKLGKLFL